MKRIDITIISNKGGEWLARINVGPYHFGLADTPIKALEYAIAAWRKWEAENAPTVN